MPLLDLSCSFLLRKNFTTAAALSRGLGDRRRDVVRYELSFRARSWSGLATRVVPPKPDVGVEFDSLVSRNPQVGVRILEQALRQRRLGAATSRTAKEEISRKKWILELASIIREAGLPAATRIDTMSNPEAAWVRAFGSRRAKPLKNRVLAWKKGWCLASGYICCELACKG